MTIDYHRLEEVVRGKSILVTGGGGSIGAEICDRVVTFGAARLLVVEHSEVALHTVLETLRAKGTAAEIDGRIADVRDRERIMRVFADYRPEIVFHAAALKHVPLLGARLGRGDQDQRVRLGERGRCRGGGRRRGAGDDLDRQGDRAGLGAGRDQAARRDVLRRRSMPILCAARPPGIRRCA